MPIDFVAALPGLVLKHCRSAGRYHLLAPGSPEYDAILGQERAVADYLGRFSTPFGDQLNPPIIGATRQARRPNARDLVAFRDCVAIPAIIEARRQELTQGRPRGFPYSDSFDFYTVHPARDGESVTLHTPREIGTHELASFHGQPTPLLLHPNHQSVEFDDVLGLPLLSLFASRRVDRALRAKILRSLHAAYAACRAPFHHLGGSLDFGMTTSSWVTAFEVLAHPGGTGDVTWKHVSELINRVPWPDPSLRRRSRVPVVGAGRRGPKGRVNPPVQVYGRLYAARNAYLHGEPELAAARRHLSDGRRGRMEAQAAILYRFVLLRVLADAGLYDFPRVPAWRDGMSEERRARYGREFARDYHERQVGRALLRPARDDG